MEETNITEVNEVKEVKEVKEVNNLRKRAPYKKHTGPISTYILTRPDGKIQEIQYQRKKVITKEMMDEIRDKISNGEKRIDLAVQYNISLPTIRKYLSLYN